MRLIFKALETILNGDPVTAAEGRSPVAFLSSHEHSWCLLGKDRGAESLQEHRVEQKKWYWNAWTGSGMKSIRFHSHSSISEPNLKHVASKQDQTCTEGMCHTGMKGSLPLLLPTVWHGRNIDTKFTEKQKQKSVIKTFSESNLGSKLIFPPI